MTSFPSLCEPLYLLKLIVVYYFISCVRVISAENEKKKKYLDAVEAGHASFTPFVTSIDGVLAHEANSVVKLLATKIALKWEKSLSAVTEWVRPTLAFAILASKNHKSVHKMKQGLDYPHQLMNIICICYYVCACAWVCYLFLCILFILCIIVTLVMVYLLKVVIMNVV